MAWANGLVNPFKTNLNPGPIYSTEQFQKASKSSVVRRIKILVFYIILVFYKIVLIKSIFIK